MSDAEDIEAAIVDNATGPASVTVGNETVTAKSVDDLVKAAHHIASQEAAAAGGIGIRLFQCVPPGCG